MLLLIQARGRSVGRAFRSHTPIKFQSVCLSLSLWPSAAHLFLAVFWWLAGRPANNLIDHTKSVLLFRFGTMTATIPSCSDRGDQKCQNCFAFVVCGDLVVKRIDSDIRWRRGETVFLKQMGCNKVGCSLYSWNRNLKVIKDLLMISSIEDFPPDSPHHISR